MGNKKTIKCVVCEKSESYIDVKDLKYDGWKVLGWDMNKNEPVCVCKKCEYPVEKRKE